MLNETFNNLINEADSYPSLAAFRENVGGPSYHIDNVLGIMKNMEELFTKELQEDLSTILKLTENAVRLEKSNENKKTVKKILYKYQHDSYKFKKQKMDSLITNFTRALQGMTSLEEAFKLASKLYSEIE